MSSPPTEHDQLVKSAPLQGNASGKKALEVHTSMRELSDPVSGDTFLESSNIPPQESQGQEADSELQAATRELAENYKRFLTKNRQVLTLEAEIQGAIQGVHGDLGELSQSANLFRERISTVIEIKCQRDGLSMSRWPSKVGKFLVALFPVVKLSVSIASSVGEVIPLFGSTILADSKGSGFLPLKYAGNGVGVILQVLYYLRSF